LKVPRLFARLFAAIQFLTRFPVPRATAISEAQLGKAAALFPLVGLIVGGCAALVFLLALAALPLSAAVLCSIIIATVITNAFHEDGLADSFDGFGGGWTKERTLEIMHDSRIGTYGALALIFLVLGKLTFLSVLPQQQVWRWLIVAHTAARWTTLPLCAWLPYARTEGQGKLVARQVGAIEIVIGTVTLLLALFLIPKMAAVVALTVSGLITCLSGLYFRRRIQGVTGDCLGAANQLTEVGLYLTAVILLRLGLLS